MKLKRITHFVLRFILGGIAVLLLALYLVGRHPADVQDVGWNSSTIGLMGTLAFALLGAVGLLDQEEKVWRLKSGQSVSVTAYLVLTAMAGSGLLYGTEKRGIALVAHWGSRLIFASPVVVGLWKFKGFTRKERSLGIFLLLAFGVSLFLPRKLGYGAFSLATIFGAGKQLCEIIKERHPGSLSLRLMGIYFLSSAFWVLYAWTQGDRLVLWVSLAYVIINASAICLMLRYRPRDKPRRKFKLPDFPLTEPEFAALANGVLAVKTG